MNENFIVKEYEFNKPLIQKVDCLIVNSIGDCRNKYFHTFDDFFEYDIQLANIGNNQIFNLIIADK